MSMEKKPVNEELLEQVAGGLLVFGWDSNVLTYNREDGSNQEYKILDFRKAWEYCTSLSKDTKEEEIIQKLINMKYIE